MTQLSINKTSKKFDRSYFDRHSEGLKLCIELIRSSSQLDRIIDKNLRQQFGQSISRFDLLAQLYREQTTGLSIGELGNRLISAKGNITGLINRMSKDDLLFKKANTHDRRSFQVFISAKGMTLFKEMADCHSSWVYELFYPIDLEAIKNMTGMLANIRSSLEIKPET